ncbi:hypothetical protein K7X08_019568 [Anisodus acutangulus]|uniref:Uncharacterized protein n=1 Tax=Anisodus acutangulus TaxID=402998 RepID=A0A9Q1RPW6_9SOLA|nr:hypothetical protein K7X08_019568 [Anisodus acutangulus]
MAHNVFRAKQSSSSPRDKSVFLAAIVAVLLVCAIWTFTDPLPNISGLLFNQNISSPDYCPPGREAVDRRSDPPEKTFYDDPELSYTINKPIKNWDEKRIEWLKLHPSFAAGRANRVLLLTGSQPTPCKNPKGDHLLLRFFKNKVDYCRIHGYDIFYGNTFFHPKMRSYWAKIPLVRAAMLAHPESEWVLWIDSDAIFTDMDFKIPLHKYNDYNFIVHGWPDLIFKKKSWVAINAGIFLIRNCQWSMDFLDVWANMGPKSPEYKHWGKILRTTFKDKTFPESDDQSALSYLILKGEHKWRSKIHAITDYSLHGYWLGIVNRFDKITENYTKIERDVPKLRRRHAEAVSESYAAAWEPLVAEGGDGRGGWRRPFITHFTGCQPCSGDHAPEYVGDSCWVGMEKALNFADNQVLRNFGFMDDDIKSNSPVSTVNFDFPAEEVEEFV